MTDLALAATPAAGARFAASRRRRLRSAVVLASALVITVAIGDALAGIVLDPASRTANALLDLFICVVAGLVILTRPLWRGWPAVPGLVLGVLLVNNTLLTIVVTPGSFGLALAYLTMTIVAAPILLPWGRHAHLSFLTAGFVLSAGYGWAMLWVGLPVPVHDLFVAVAGALLVSGVTHAVLLRMARRAHEQSLRARRSHLELRLSSAALREREAQLAEAQAIGRIGSWAWTIADSSVQWSSEQRRIFGVDEAFVPSREAYLALVHPDDRPAAERFISAGLRSGSFAGDLRIVTPSGEQRWIHAKALTHRGPDGEPTGMTGTCQEITERKLADAELERLALHDALTGLPNRTLFRDRLGQALVASRSWDELDPKVAVAFLDIDDFKLVNDSGGHGEGDALLRVIATRLAGNARPADTVARLGGDEFGILLRDVDAEGSLAACERLLEVLAEPVELGGRSFRVTASIGLVASVSATSTTDELLRHADVAMYEAKGAGKGRVVAFEPVMAEGVRDRRVLRDELRAALDEQDLLLVYQPQYDLPTRQVVGVEALVRWQHRTKGLLAPDAFIALAEASGLIVDLDRWVVEHACRQLAAWLADGVPPIRLAINVSVLSIEQPSFAGRVRDTIVELGLPPELIELEITESHLIGDGWQSARAVDALRAFGLRIAIDDFGTGYSVLARLDEIAFDAIKIDRRFVSEVSDDGATHPLLVAMIGMARALDVRVVAEGIETVAQLEFLRAHGCDEGQGYYFSPPVDPARIARLLRASMTATASGRPRPSRGTDSPTGSSTWRPARRARPMGRSGRAARARR